RRAAPSLRPPRKGLATRRYAPREIASQGARLVERARAVALLRHRELSANQPKGKAANARKGRNGGGVRVGAAHNLLEAGGDLPLLGSVDGGLVLMNGAADESLLRYSVGAKLVNGCEVRHREVRRVRVPLLAGGLLVSDSELELLQRLQIGLHALEPGVLDRDGGAHTILPSDRSQSGVLDVSTYARCVRKAPSSAMCMRPYLVAPSSASSKLPAT